MGPIHTGSGLNGAVAAMVNGYLHVCGGYDGTILIINSNKDITITITKITTNMEQLLHCQPEYV